MALRSGNFFKQNWLSGVACTTPNKGNANRRSRKRRSEKSLESKPAICPSHPPGTHYQEFLDAGGSQPHPPQPGTDTRRPHYPRRRSRLLSQTTGAQVLASMLCLCTVSVSHPNTQFTSSQRLPPLSIQLPTAAEAAPCPTEAQDLGRCPQRPTTLSSAKRSPARWTLVSVSLLATRCQGLTYPQPHSRSRWLLCEGRCAQRLVAADPRFAPPRPAPHPEAP